MNESETLKVVIPTEPEANALFEAMIDDAIAHYDAGTSSSPPMPKGPSTGSLMHDEVELRHQSPTDPNATVGDELVFPRLNATPTRLGGPLILHLFSSLGDWPGIVEFSARGCPGGDGGFRTLK